MVSLEERISRELLLFDSDEQRACFRQLRTEPVEVVLRWQYGEEPHRCIVVAADGVHCLLYCASGFGPNFPWAVKPVDETDLGTDGEWCAYMYEAFVASPLWPAGPTAGFMLFGPGERI